MKNKLERLKIIHNLLKEKEISINQIHLYLENNYRIISKRQIIRDVIDLKYLLDENEILNTKYVGREKYLFVFKTNFDDTISKDFSAKTVKTSFGNQKQTKFIKESRNLIEQIILKHSKIKIKTLINDETGDNYYFETKPFIFFPIILISHKNSCYLGGWNVKRKCVQFFGINQIIKITDLNKSFSYQEYELLVKKEIESRFGVTKNINNKIYNIKLEFSLPTGSFVRNHYWHHSQKFFNDGSKIIMKLNCGINRELVSWIFSWMYNVKIIEPPILKDYFLKTIDEINQNYNSLNPLLYKNFFIDIH